MANKLKDRAANTYDWIPEVMVSIDPAPRYHSKALLTKHSDEWISTTRAAEGLEKVKTGIMGKQQMQEKAEHGRLWAHIKHIEMRNHIKKIRKQEGTFKEELSEEAQLQEIMKGEKIKMSQSFNIDQELHLPYGFGFDLIIKEKNDLISNKKFHNNKVMDELVEKLGYLDYRDALAANKYILEAKRHGDYHQ